MRSGLLPTTAKDGGGRRRSENMFSYLFLTFEIMFYKFSESVFQISVLLGNTGSPKTSLEPGSRNSTATGI